MKKVILTNGLRVVNFSSPHPFHFEDGSILEACTKEECNSFMLHCKEDVTVTIVNGVCVEDIKIEFEATIDILNKLQDYEVNNEVDIVLVPFPVMEAVKKTNYVFNKMRVIRVADRFTKVIFNNRFCV